MTKEQETLDEESVSADVGGFAGPIGSKPTKKKKKKQEQTNFISRREFVEEMMFREVLREMIREIKKEKLLQESKKESEILQFRKVLRHLIKEATKDIEDAPHSSTAINILEELLKSILPNLETDYKTLTTKKEQRDSFRAHIVNAVSTTLETEEVNDDSDMLPSLDEQEEEEVSIKVDDDGVDIGDEKFIDIDPAQAEETEEEEDTFTIQGQDETGRAMAQKSFDKIEKNIIETYGILSDEQDQKLFTDYLITNLKLYFDKWESELGAVIEPTTDEYESEKDQPDIEDAVDTGIDLDTGGEELIQ